MLADDGRCVSGEEQEVAMTEEQKTASAGIQDTAEQTIDLARGAMESYLDFFQKAMFASPWGQTDLNKKIQSYAGKNLASTFEFAQKLTKAKDLQELVHIQSEFMQTQLKALNEQAKDLGETATQAATGAFKGQFPSS
jgi:phasin family protein